MSTKKRIACWLSEKKLQKLSWNELEATFRAHGYDLFRLDLNGNFESQEPFCALLHKLTDLIALAEQGDEKSSAVINRLESYLKNNPMIAVVDSFPSVRILIDRYQSYSLVQSAGLKKYKVFTPAFCEISNSNEQLIEEQLKASRVNYPFVCKPAMAHGSKAHVLSIIFNKKGLKDCNAPCVAQSFVNHNAVLYKLFIVGDKMSVFERPSLKNFHADSQKETIFFYTADVSKAGSQSHLSILDPEDRFCDKPKPDPDVMENIAVSLRKLYKMDLLGVDIVIENNTGKYAIIDINVFPGYDGFPNFYNNLVECVKQKIDAKFI